MEQNRFENNLGNNPETGWNNSRERILEDIYVVERKIEKVQRRKQENIN